MFQRRLKWFVILLSILALIVVGRLIDVQLVSASQFETLADRMLTRPVRYLRAPRGDILDRTGRPLVSDVPAFDLTIQYRALAGMNDYLSKTARKMRSTGRFPASQPVRDIVDELKLRISGMWARLSEVSGVPLPELHDRAHAIVERVRIIRENHIRRRGFVEPVLEENAFHPIIEALDEDMALALRLEFDPIDYPWLAVSPGARRRAFDADPLAHVLGRMGAASAARIAGDPLREDELRRLSRGDQCGVSGVEYAAETALRGVRGYVIEDFDRTEIERVQPSPGRPVRLTIDAELQNRAYDILKQAVDASEFPCGGSAVVIDARSREVLALVSYPTYSIDRFAEDYEKIESDARWAPHRFRAVANQYPPGSVCKVITLAGALSDGLVTPQTRFACTGHLLPNQPGMFRCWIYNQHLQTHAAAGYPNGLDADDAIKNSCNLYFFHAGERLGPERLCEWFQRFGLGSLQGTGLLEESRAIVPTPEYLRSRGRTYEPSDVWNYSIGQGEVTATPLQAANSAADVAIGRHQNVRLFLDDVPGVPEYDASVGAAFDEAALRSVRSGMYAVVNESGGTAYRYARMNVAGHVLCGKTGSAQATPRVINSRFTYAWPDGRRDAFVAADEAEARAALYAKYPELKDSAADGRSDSPPESVQTAAKRPMLIGKHAAERYPPMGPEDKLPSHAWFIGYTQAADTPRGGVPRGRVLAISVVIEYGGSGGHVGSPVAKKIAEIALERAPLTDADAVGMR